MKAKSIDRLALTREKFGTKMYGDRPEDGGRIPYEKPVAVNATQHREGYSTCPSCGRETLRHDGSCVLCENCGYSKCG